MSVPARTVVMLSVPVRTVVMLSVRRAMDGASAREHRMRLSLSKHDVDRVHDLSEVTLRQAQGDNRRAQGDNRRAQGDNRRAQGDNA
jgi:hypothetical protein